MDHPTKVEQIRRMLVEKARWDTVEVTQHSPGFWIVRAERYAGTLAQSQISIYVSTRRSKQGRMAGGYRSSTLGSDKKLRTWRDVEIWAGI